MMKDEWEFTELVHDPNIEILGDLMVLEDLLIATYKYKNESNMIKPGKTSLAIAAFVTAHARIMLHNEIKKLHQAIPHSVLYCDTDSHFLV